MSTRVLLLLPRVPYPKNDGGALAMFQTIEMYHEMGFEVNVLAINTNKHWLSDQDWPPLFRKINSFKTVAVNTDVKVKDAFINLFSKQSYNVARFINKEYTKALESELSDNEFDIIQFESIFTAPYLAQVKELTKAKCICRLHNVEYQIWQQVADREKAFLKKKYLLLLAKRLKEYELNILNEFDELLTISPNDEEILAQENITTPTYYLPYGVEKTRFKSDTIQCEHHSIYHLGSMDWLPNQEAMTWFAGHVWPVLHKELPKLNFYMAGKNTPTSYFNLKRKGIDVVGEVDDATTFHLEKNILVVPLQSGAGVRIKLLEAMLLGKTIICTKRAAQGISLIDGEHLLIAETPTEFTEKIKWCLENKEASTELGQNAKYYVLEHFEKRKIYQGIKEHFNLSHVS